MFSEGDIVLIGSGHIHWEVLVPGVETTVLKSGMTDRRRIERTTNLKPWKPGL